jgi:hypothetical protein
MEDHLMRVGLILALCFAVSLAGFGPAQAGIVTISGYDNGAGPTDPRPNSDAAAATFDAIIGVHNTITFEGLPLGFSTPVTVFPGVTVTLTNADSSIPGISNVGATDIGYNTTASGSQFLQVSPAINGGNVSVTFSFAVPISFFGAYLTGTQAGFPGPIALDFNDGSHEELVVPKNDETGGVQFFGFIDFGKAISSVTFTESGPFESRDIWGIDDVRTSAVPLPSAVLLFGSGLLRLGIYRRRKMASSS